LRGNFKENREKIIWAVYDFHSKKGYPPTLREIAKEVGLPWNTVKNYFYYPPPVGFQNGELLQWEGHMKSRTIRLGPKVAIVTQNGTPYIAQCHQPRYNLTFIKVTP
jgi:hypothetical protein